MLEQENTCTRKDFLQLLLDTTNEDVSQEPKQLQEADDLASVIELVAKCWIFFLAGFESTATTLSLALNPQVQQKAIQEFDSALSSLDGNISYESLQNMKYLDNVMLETLRVYPAGLSERAKRDQLVYMSFGLGPRNCIGTLFVLVEMKDVGGITLYQ
ncbi:cytochrome P450 3A9-like [Uloborus diversus]|uniref:cytochrome P450 3A9-like n=1 Tax=Uloborus diversus TaxID=327109 RepID=UPI002409C9B9|nr:cytochrome P450 3A9-like [Uloborus diversus]